MAQPLARTAYTIPPDIVTHLHHAQEQEEALQRSVYIARDEERAAAVHHQKATQEVLAATNRLRDAANVRLGIEEKLKNHIMDRTNAALAS